jgi:hypothetical protein
MKEELRNKKSDGHDRTWYSSIRRHMRAPSSPPGSNLFSSQARKLHVQKLDQLITSSRELQAAPGALLISTLTPRLVLLIGRSIFSPALTVVIELILACDGHQDRRTTHTFSKYVCGNRADLDFPKPVSTNDAPLIIKSLQQCDLPS